MYEQKLTSLSAPPRTHSKRNQEFFKSRFHNNLLVLYSLSNWIFLIIPKSTLSDILTYCLAGFYFKSNMNRVTLLLIFSLLLYTRYKNSLDLMNAEEKSHC